MITENAWFSLIDKDGNKIMNVLNKISIKRGNFEKWHFLTASFDLYHQKKTDF